MKVFINIIIELPVSLKFNESTGDISGLCTIELPETVFTITCKNATATLETRLSLTVNQNAYFIDKYIDDTINIVDAGKKMIRLDSGCSHCYLNLKINEGVYHILYQLKASSDAYRFYFGLTSDNKNPNKFLCDNKKSCGVWIGNGGNELTGGIGEKLSVPNIICRGDSCIECIFNMNEKTFSVKYEDGYASKIFQNIDNELYPFVIVFYKDDYVKIKRYWKEKKQKQEQEQENTI